MKTEEVMELYRKYVMNTYTRLPISLSRGKGSRVWDLEQREYLDFFPGWGVSCLGHCYPKVTSRIKEQAKRLIHVSNNYYHHLQARLAKKIINLSFPGKVFFCNSGAEANESAFKLARLYGEGKRFEIIAFENSFHGRTLATLSATGQRKYQEGFEPLLPGFVHIPFNDIEAVKRAINEKTVAVIIELIQGEGGVRVADFAFVKELYRLCQEKKILLIVDEVQTGMGRTGKLFCYQHYGVTPDMMTLAKSLGGGLPIGAMVAKEEIADYFKPGMHASTFGGSPLVCKTALAVLEAIERENLLKNCYEMGDYLKGKLKMLKEKFNFIREIRGMGLMLAMELDILGKPIVEECLKRGLLINCTQDKVLRIMPAINVKKKEIDKAVKILEDVLKEQ
ncbi:MAG: aspartate aminotransferase family protein [Candidatus Omnitrophica bacterium]|nr:aspartate aminotransferase family protein [Candidatus Omnitrophota bacterium]MCM8793932.1 aspartate aminotransferase family protein [Candidatus Omnitrophota bacterium]